MVAIADLVAVRVNVELLVGLTPFPPANLRLSFSSSNKDDLVNNCGCSCFLLSNISRKELSSSSRFISETLFQLLLVVEIDGV